ncbi:hypothetical protein QE152_g31047 [Popillia japonica]|uniref:Uncharacterized protein n=1 Tax=Popillia japonica TaxID=7064 RepID=A0AAW1JCR8_POPJA
MMMLHNLDKITSNDPLDCIKSFVCQVAVQVKGNNEVLSTIDFIRNIPDNKHTVEIKKAIKIGTLYRSREYCRNIYNKCPYTAAKMLQLIKIVGG